jgi:hypothetical protein
MTNVVAEFQVRDSYFCGSCCSQPCGYKATVAVIKPNLPKNDVITLLEDKISEFLRCLGPVSDVCNPDLQQNHREILKYANSSAGVLENCTTFAHLLNAVRPCFFFF